MAVHSDLYIGKDVADLQTMISSLYLNTLRPFLMITFKIILPFWILQISYLL